VIPIRYHEEVEGELLNAVGYLEIQAKGLGRRLWAEIKRAENFIAQFPESAKEIRPGIRKRILRTFQYSLIYSLEKDGALILAVAHHRRRPGYWVGRVQGGKGHEATGA